MGVTHTKSRRTLGSLFARDRVVLTEGMPVHVELKPYPNDTPADHFASALQRKIGALEDFLSGLRQMLKHQTPIEAAEFQSSIGLAVRHFGVSSSDLARAFGMNAGTASRWANGKSVPAIVARRAVIQWIVERVEQDAITLRTAR